MWRIARTNLTIINNQTPSSMRKSHLIAMCLSSLFGLILVGGGYHLNASELVASQAEKVITGIVQDVNGEPIIGASVIQDKTSNGVITGVDGSFSLNVPEGAKVVIACLGYQDNVITVGKQTHFVITLQDSAEFLEEVVYMGLEEDYRI